MHAGQKINNLLGFVFLRRTSSVLPNQIFFYDGPAGRHRVWPTIFTIPLLRQHCYSPYSVIQELSLVHRLTLGFRTIPVPQLTASNSNNSQRPNCCSPLTNCTALSNWTELGRKIHISSNGSTENAECNTSSIVAWRRRVRDAFLCCVCTDHYLAMGLNATTFPGLSLQYDRLKCLPLFSTSRLS
jgi:hypothetical protein